MRVLVTGAAGFIGSHLSQRLLARGDQVTGLDNFDAFYDRAIKVRNLDHIRASAGGAPPSAAASPPAFAFFEGDLRNPEDLTRAFSHAPPDAVVHLAALAGVRPSIHEPARYADVNLTGTQRLLDACSTHGVRRLAFASSSSVYGLDSAVPFAEADPCLRPVSPYAATKRAGELLCFTAHHLTGVGVTSLRFFTVYGPRQRPDLAIHKFTRLISTGQPIELFGDGTTSRDYTFIDDIVDGCVAAIDQLIADPQGRHRTYNLGGSQTTTLRELVELISSTLGRQARITWLPEQPGDMQRTLADLSTARAELGYQPRVPMVEGIRRFADWFLQSPASSPVS